MHDVQLSAAQLITLRALLRLDPVPGRPIPPEETFQLLNDLVPCDELGAGLTDLHGRTVCNVVVSPSGRRRSTVATSAPAIAGPATDDGGPHYLGYMHWNEHPLAAEGREVDIASTDELSIGFRNGTEHIVQYFFIRSAGRFSPEELALLWMLGPALERLARERPTPQLPTCLTLTERRILTHVAAGLSNSEIAESLCIATGTVRKHLENCYRKLGVTNRVAAIARLQGADRPGLDLRERIDKYA